MDCAACGHDGFDHESIPDPDRSGVLGRCRFASRCGCEQFTPED